jgi:prepilin-type N-terminal cleavage/methylation domain-containing protein
MGAYTQKSSGFTLVEISIVMIIIGLLIGGTFGGMKLIDNMQVNRTVQDLKAIESAALTFKDTYGRLPGDMPNTAARLPNCTVAPCATGGNGDRTLEGSLAYNVAIAATSERFTFWSHLLAADFLSMDYKNTTDLNFGEGQPSAPIDGGYRMTALTGSSPPCGTIMSNAILSISSDSDAPYGTTRTLTCSDLEALDRKLDDGKPYSGRLNVISSTTLCAATPSTCSSDYNPNSTSPMYAIWYDVKF